MTCTSGLAAVFFTTYFRKKLFVSACCSFGSLYEEMLMLKEAEIMSESVEPLYRLFKAYLDLYFEQFVN